MAHTFFQNYFHLVWSTKERLPLILDANKGRVFEYLGGCLKTLGCIPLQIGGMSDHIHLLAAIPPKFAVSEIVRDIKVASSKWINSSLTNTKGFSWQEGYGSFSVSTSQKEVVSRYILDQEKHHQTKTFREEFIEFLKIHNIEFDEKYLWQ
jgi:REP element-mobilizing transposase RayT